MNDSDSGNGNNKRVLHVANVGDSRCVACVAGQAAALSTDHKVPICMGWREYVRSGVR